jgi:hypothetical protein
MKKFKNRITYKNKAYFQVEVLYKQPKNLILHDADRIRVTLKGDKQKPNISYMHALEAIDLIYLLSGAVGELITEEMPLASRD